MHGNCRYGHFKDSVFRPKIEKCKQFSEMVRFWTVASKIPPTLCMKIRRQRFLEVGGCSAALSHSARKNSKTSIPCGLVGVAGSSDGNMRVYEWLWGDGCGQ